MRKGHSTAIASASLRLTPWLQLSCLLESLNEDAAADSGQVADLRHLEGHVTPAIAQYGVVRIIPGVSAISALYSNIILV